MTFQQFIKQLDSYWSEQGCVLVQPLDLEVGAGTGGDEAALFAADLFRM